MQKIKSDFKILLEIAKEYIIGVPSIRNLLVPTFTTMLIAKYLEVKVTNLCKEISENLGNSTKINMIVIKYGIILIGSILLGEIQCIFICKASKIAFTLANKQVYKLFIDLNPARFNLHYKGEIQNSILRRAEGIQDIIDVCTLNFFPTFLTVIFISHRMVYEIGINAVVMINLGIIVYAISTITITKKRNQIRKNINEANNNSSNILIDGLLNHETVYAYNNQELEVNRYTKALKRLEVHSMRLEQSKYILNIVQRGVWCILSIVIIGASVNGLMMKNMNAGKFTFFVSAIQILTKSFDNFGYMYGRYQQALINIRSADFCVNIVLTGGFKKKNRFEDKIRIENLSLYSRDNLLSQNITFGVKKGEKVAIIGKNGVGKSTLLKTIIKMQPMMNGNVLIDDESIADLCEESTRNLISYVSQNATLFNASVIYNIKYGVENVCNETVYELSKKFGLHDSISRLENGYETNVGEQGNKLSGGERQKVIILRTLLKSSPILVMDEPTAALDKEAELGIFEKLMKLNDITIITIVHNLELLNHFDKIFFLEFNGIKEVSKLENYSFNNLKILSELR